MMITITSDKDSLAEREAIIESGLKTFVEVGNALLYIRDNALYKTVSGFKAFEEYCSVRWGMSDRHARHLMHAATVATALEQIGTIVPESESQIRPLTKLEPEQRQEAWQAAVETSGGSPTAKDVKAAVERIQERSAPASKVPRYVPADGMQYAQMAKLNLEKIQPKDIQREQALRHIIDWCEKRLRGDG